MAGPRGPLDAVSVVVGMRLIIVLKLDSDGVVERLQTALSLRMPLEQEPQPVDR